MTAWIQHRFADADRALTTIAVSAAALGLIGFLLVIGAVLASR